MDGLTGSESLDLLRSLVLLWTSHSACQEVVLNAPKYTNIDKDHQPIHQINRSSTDPGMFGENWFILMLIIYVRVNSRVQYTTAVAWIPPIPSHPTPLLRRQGRRNRIALVANTIYQGAVLVFTGKLPRGAQAIFNSRNESYLWVTAS